MQREHGEVLTANGNLVAGAADDRDGTWRAEEGGQHLFIADSTVIRTESSIINNTLSLTHAGVVNEYEVVVHDVTPDHRLSSDPSLSKGQMLAGHLVFARSRGNIPPECFSAV